MEKTIEFLQNPNYDWSINRHENKSFIDIAEEHDYTFESSTSKTSREVQKFLKDKIKSILSGNDFDGNNFKKILSHLSLVFYSSSETKNKKIEDSFYFIASLNYIINTLDGFNNNLENWMEAKKLLESYLSLSNSTKEYILSMREADLKIANFIKYLRNKGLKVEIINGEILLDKETELKICAAIAYRLNKFGRHATDHILNNIKFKLSEDRYFFRRDPKIDEELHIPWGYLFNLSLKSLSDPAIKPNKKNIRELDNLFKEIKEISINYFAILKLQELNKFYDLNHTNKTIIDALKRVTLYDQLFCIDQIRESHILKIFDGMLCSDECTSTAQELTIYRDVLLFLSEKANDKKPLIIEKNYLHKHLEEKHHKHEILQALNNITHKINKINEKYLIPSEVDNLNYYKKPLIDIKSHYLYFNSLFFSFGFYYSATEKLASSGFQTNRIGNLHESFVKKELIKRNITISENKFYKIPKSIRNELSTRRDQGECDLIIETNETIIFIELKCKTLTAEARGGNTLKIVSDFTKSFFNAIYQAGIHEYILRRDGALKFTDGTMLEFKNRNVEKISLSLFDFRGLQDPFFSQEIMKSLINSEIKSDYEKEDNEINKTLRDIQSQYNTEIFKKEYLSGGLPFMNCRFFSTPQLLTILENCNNNETFLVELNRTKQVTFGSKDWYFDYHHAREIYGLKNGESN